MKYIIMAGGEYDFFKTPKHLTEINGERIIERTIRLLKENNVKDIAISSNSPLFDNLGVPRLEHNNSFKHIKGIDYGYWLDAYYPVEEPVCYLYGDVYYSEKAIETIVNYQSKENTLFGTSDAKNIYHQNWGEPFAYKVFDYKSFFKGIKEVKRLQDEGVTDRMPITWELYRYLNNLDINVQQVLDKTYICIDDETMDVDYPEEVEEMIKRFKKKGE